MELTVVDYSEVYYVLLSNTTVPLQRGGKFVIMKNTARQYAVFSPQELSAYHANIIERFLWQQGIQGRYNEKGDHFCFVSAEWRVDGGGHWELDEAKGVLCIFGYSKVYGGVDLHSLAAKLRQTEHFQTIQVVIDSNSSVL